MLSIDPIETPNLSSDMEVHARARALLAAKSLDSEHLIDSRAPSALDLVDSRVLVSAMVGLVMVALVQLNAARHVGVLDALDLALRMVALGSLARLAFAVGELSVKHARARRASRRSIALLDEHLVLFDGGDATSDRIVRRDEVVGAYGGRRLDGSAELWLFVARAGVPSALSADVVTAADPAVLATRIQRWRGRAPTVNNDKYPDATRTPDKELDRIARGELGVGECAIPLSYRWLARGPYAAAAFVLVLGERAMHLPSGARLAAPVLGLSLACVALPLAWLAIQLRAARPKRGVAVTLTPAELLLREAAGIHRAPFGDVSGLSIRSRRTWTLMGGVSNERVLVVERASNTDLTFDERAMRISAPALAALLEAYGEGAFSLSSPALQGSAAGGGSSATEGTTT